MATAGEQRDAPVYQKDLIVQESPLLTLIKELGRLQTACAERILRVAWLTDLVRRSGAKDCGFSIGLVVYRTLDCRGFARQETRAA